MSSPGRQAGNGGAGQSRVQSQAKDHRGWLQPGPARGALKCTQHHLISRPGSWAFCSPQAPLTEDNFPGTFHLLRVRCGQSGSGSLRSGLRRMLTDAGSWKQMQTEARERAYQEGPRGSGGTTERACYSTFTISWFSLCSEGYVANILTKIFELLRFLCDTLSVGGTQGISASI